MPAMQPAANIRWQADPTECRGLAMLALHGDALRSHALAVSHG